MTQVQTQKALLIQRLTQLAADPELPTKARAQCGAFLDRFQAPVRVGIFGLPGSGKRDVLNALLQGDIVQTDAPPLTMEFVPGQVTQTTATLADGSTSEVPGYPSPDLMQQGPMFVTVSCPICANDARRYLIVECDAQREDVLAGLQWASSRADIAIWCTRQWSQLEADVWSAAPENLLAHAILVLPVADAAIDGQNFEHVVRHGTPDSALEETLQQIIDDATAQDLLSLELFLQRYGATVDLPPNEPADIIDLDMPADPAGPPPEARSELAQLFAQVRGAADGLLQVVSETNDEPEQVLEAFETVFENIADHTSELENATEVWPEIENTVEDARDLALLLRMEGGADQVTDAARLLLQLRYEMETRLAA